MAGLPTEAISPQGEERVYFRDVFAWMAGGLGVTGGVAAVIGHDATALNALLQGTGRDIWIVCLLLELALVLGLSGLVQHMGLVEAAASFLGFAALNGLTISVIFAAYTTGSIYSTFLITAAMFAALAVWGYLTKADLTGWGSFLLMALTGQVIGVLVNAFWLNSTLYWVTTATGVLLFSALTAYDVQKLKRIELPGEPGSAAVEKSAIIGALSLYLDFINLFLYLLRLFGRRR
jgi:FtsH-binding integral membrane protein